MNEERPEWFVKGLLRTCGHRGRVIAFKKVYNLAPNPVYVREKGQIILFCTFCRIKVGSTFIRQNARIKVSTRVLVLFARKDRKKSKIKSQK